MLLWLSGFLFFSSEAMTVQINNKLLKSRNPIEHELRLENQIGKVVQCVGDGYNLIEFESLKIKNKKKRLQWYVHVEDFKKIENIKKNDEQR